LFFQSVQGKSALATGLAFAPMTAVIMLAGVGIALTVPSVMTAGLAGTGPERVGIGSGVINTARQIGGAMGVALFGSLIGTAGGDVFVVGMRVSIALAGLALVTAGIVAVIYVPRRVRSAGMERQAAMPEP